MYWVPSIFIACIIFQKLCADISVSYNKEHLLKDIQIKNHGSIEYFYDDHNKLIQVNRIDEKGTLQYFANYAYDENGILSHETMIYELGIIHFNEKTASSPYHFESYEKTENHITHALDEYIFNYPQAPIKSVNNPLFTYTFDDDSKLIEANTQDKVIQFAYENKKRIKTKKIKDKVTQIESYYLVNGEEIAIFDADGALLELKIPGLPLLPGLSKPIAIEKNGKIYATICDKFLNIYKLIDIASREVFTFLFDPFGKKLSAEPLISRFCYRGKIFDSDLNLFYFGHRYYDVENRVWLSEDPIGNFQNDNLSCYCNDEPWNYLDPDGRFHFIVPISGSPSFEESLKTALLSFGLSLITPQLIEDCNLWLNKKADARRMEKFLKIQKRRHQRFL